MTTLATQSFLETNLAALGERNSDLRDKLLAVEPRPDVVFTPTSEADSGVPAGVAGGKPLCSRHRPLEEASRLVADVDVLDHAVFVVIGFGMGYHVRRLAERVRKVGCIVILETDLPLLRAVLENVDHSQWLRESLTVWITDAHDRGSLARKLEGAEAIIAQGVHFFEHPASRARLAEDGQRFAVTFSQLVSSARTTLLTTLVRSVDTIRNFMLNLDHYAAGAGISDLKDAASGRLGIVVSAGPSLRRNLHLLKAPDVRERCVIVAVQTMLKPLLEEGIRPHFITALDYHEISRRFYEGLREEDVRGVTLIADPKVHPAVIDAYPGAVRCCAAGFLDQLLGDVQREMGALPAGATVAHLSVYVARYLGCNPIALIGQDLGFTDGLYYTPGTAIHDVWSTELNPFNTIEMMEWQRIVRHRLHLRKVTDVHGKSIFTDMQMTTYLQQFERDFAHFEREGLSIIDATEGGVHKQHTTVMPLAEVLQRHAAPGSPPLKPLPQPPAALDAARLKAADARLRRVQRQVALVREASRRTASPLRGLLDPATAEVPGLAQTLLNEIGVHRKTVEQNMPAFDLLNSINQLGVFKRLRADRRIKLSHDQSPAQQQRAQLERDLDNVTWIADAADELLALLADARKILQGKTVEIRTRSHGGLLEGGTKGPSNNGSDHSPCPASASLIDVKSTISPRFAAIVPIDPQRNGLGVPRLVTEQFEGRSVLQATLERLAGSQRLHELIVLAPRAFDVKSLVDGGRIRLPLVIERCEGSPFGPEQEAIAAARLWADTCWRGGIGGMSVHDEIICPRLMLDIMQRRNLAAVVPIAPDWPLVDPGAESGIDALVARHLEHPQQHRLVFTQAPPGIGACLVSAELMRELAERNRLSTVGALLVYQPQLPQHDPIARDANVQIHHNVRRAMTRATFDAPRWRDRLRSRRGGRAVDEQFHDILPQHIVLELTTERTSQGLFARHPCGLIRRRPLSLDLARRLFEEAAEAGDCVVTLDGVGDPLLHPQFDEVIRHARQAGIRGVHVRTELLAPQADLDRLLARGPAGGVDVVSVDLHADRAATYEVMMGSDRFKEVLLNIDYVSSHRRKLTDHPGTAGFALPWIVPRLQRRSETHEDIDSFYDRWHGVLGAAVIESPPRFEGGDDLTDTLAEAVTPARVVLHEYRRRMTVFSDGSIPVSEIDLAGREIIGHVGSSPLRKLWARLLAARGDLATKGGEGALRMYRP